MDNLFNGKTNIWWGIIWLSIITNILYLPFAHGLYELFKKNHKIHIIIAEGLFALFVFLELSITWTNYPTIIELFQKYNLASSETQRLIILSAIEFASTSFQTPVTAFYTIILPSLATILASYVMFKSKDFGKIIPLIGFISGSCNIISVWGDISLNLLKNWSYQDLFWFYFGLWE